MTGRKSVQPDKQNLYVLCAAGVIVAAAAAVAGVSALSLLGTRAAIVYVAPADWDVPSLPSWPH